MRVDLFSDAVFAVAITLLVLNLPVPVGSGSLMSALADRWPAFAAFGISFVLVGCLWVSHYRLFRAIGEVDSTLLFLNLALLFSIVLVPFVASTLATFVTHPGSDAHLAAALFAGTLVIMGAIFGALNAHVTRRAPAPTNATATASGRLEHLRPMVGLFVNTLGVGVAFVNPVAVLVMTAAVALYYIVDQFAGAASVTVPR